MVTVGVRLPCFRLAAALRHGLGPGSSAFLVERMGPRRVVEATDAAVAAGVRRGMTLRQAARLLPRAAIAPDDPARAVRAWARVLDLLRALPCAVEDGGPGMAFLNVPRSESPERWFGRVRDRLAPVGLAVRCGAASSRFVARIATFRAGDAVCPPGREATFVADAPLALLDLDPSIEVRLNLLGARTLGQLAALPPAALRSFGPESARWHALAHGHDEPVARAGVW